MYDLFARLISLISALGDLSILGGLYLEDIVSTALVTLRSWCGNGTILDWEAVLDE
jgi:hypothetical protein